MTQKDLQLTNLKTSAPWPPVVAGLAPVTGPKTVRTGHAALLVQQHHLDQPAKFVDVGANPVHWSAYVDLPEASCDALPNALRSGKKRNR